MILHASSSEFSYQNWSASTTKVIFKSIVRDINIFKVILGSYHCQLFLVFWNKSSINLAISEILENNEDMTYIRFSHLNSDF